MGTRTPLIAGNWKMYKTPPEAAEIARQLIEIVADTADVGIMISPVLKSIKRKEEETHSPDYSRGYAELIEKLIQNKIPFKAYGVYTLLVLCWIAVISWIFVQDNQAGLLNTVEGLKWFAIKTLVFTFFAAAVVLMLRLILWLKKD